MISDISAKGLGSWKTGLRHLLFVLRLLAIIFIITALARPQTMYEEQNTEGEGVDIVLCIDVSGSMTAQDLTPNRLEAAKKVAIDFVNKRVTDRIAVVIFSGESFTQCPLTTDHPVLISAIENIRNGLLEDGTAIGSGLGTSVDRLRTSKSKSKVVILLTDGENNGGLHFRQFREVGCQQGTHCGSYHFCDSGGGCGQRPPRVRQTLRTGGIAG